VKKRSAQAVPPTSLSALNLKERSDLQEWVIQSPEILGEELLVVATEFDRFDKTSERLDVLALDQQGKLVVVELKRSAVRTTADMQALRYAAFCSTMSLDDIVELYTAYVRNREGTDLSVEEAKERILDFVSDPEFEELDNQPRIILAAEEFSPEITATVLWLRTFEMDVSCVRISPHVVEGDVVLDASVLIPLPEARDFVVRRERKEAKEASRTREIPGSWEEYAAQVPEDLRPVYEFLRNWLLEGEDTQEGVFKGLLTYRRKSDNSWISWLEHTKKEVRIGIPNGEIDPAIVVKRTPKGTPLVGIRTIDEVKQRLDLLQEAICR